MKAFVLRILNVDVEPLEEKPLEQRVQAFAQEYVKLAKKHGLMIYSDGEEIQVGEADPELWGMVKIAEGETERYYDNAIRCKY